jgi:hypothetical protein
MNRESKCEHDIDEQETAVAEHVCPLCLTERVAELEAKIARVKGLSPFYAQNVECVTYAAIKMALRDDRESWPLKRAEATASRLAEKQSNRDTDWVLALGHAVGLDSGLNVPIIPDPEVVREFLGAYVKTKLADIAGLPEKWRWLYEHPSNAAMAAVRCADELQAALGQG